MDRIHINRLLSRVASGDTQAFEQLYIATNKGVYAFLYTYLHDHHDSEDAMQEVFLKIKQSIGQFRPGTNGPAWILQIAKNHALNVLSYRSRHPMVDIDEVAAAAQTPGLDLSVMDVMQRVLSEEEQRIVTMHILWGWKHREIAEQLELPTGTITSKYKRAVDKLKAELKD